MAKKPKKFYRKKQSPEVKITKNKEQKKTIREKEKVIKEEHTQKKEFPKISRFIPELPSIKLKKLNIPSVNLHRFLKGQKKLRHVCTLSLVLLMIIVNGVVGMTLYKTYSRWSQELAKRQQLYAQMQLWENITKTYPMYRDAYFKGALIAYQLGDREKLQYFLDKLHLLDPNFPLAKPLEKLETKK